MKTIAAAIVEALQGQSLLAVYGEARTDAESIVEEVLRKHAFGKTDSAVQPQPPPAAFRPELPAVWDLVKKDAGLGPPVRPSKEQVLRVGFRPLYGVALGIADAMSMVLGTDMLADMSERDEMGTKKYGTRLQPFNGRDALKDAYQEILDFLVYIRLFMWEQDNTERKQRSGSSG